MAEKVTKNKISKGNSKYAKDVYLWEKISCNRFQENLGHLSNPILYWYTSLYPLLLDPLAHWNKCYLLPFPALLIQSENHHYQTSHSIIPKP